MRLELTLDFVDLAEHAQPTDNTVLCTVYYLELPQSAAVVNDGHGNPRNLFTYHGPADLHTLSVEQIQSLILEPSHQDSPIGLSEAPFNVTNATVDDTIMDHITRAILKLSLATVEKEIFLQLCPNYTDKPHAAVENLTQTFLDGEGNVVTYSVAQYSSILQNASRTFAHYKKYPIDLCSLFIRGLHPDVRAFLAELYTDYNAPHDLNLNGRAQRTAFSKILRLAAVAEGRVQTNERMFARHTGQTYVTNVAAPIPVRLRRLLVTTPSPPVAPTRRPISLHTADLVRTTSATVVTAHTLSLIALIVISPVLLNVLSVPVKSFARSAIKARRGASAVVNLILLISNRLSKPNLFSKLFKPKPPLLLLPFLPKPLALIALLLPPLWCLRRLPEVVVLGSPWFWLWQPFRHAF